MERIDNDPTRAGGISQMIEVPTQKIPLKRRDLPKQESKKIWKTLIVNNHPELAVHIPAPLTYVQRWVDIRPKEELQLEFYDTSYFLMPYVKIIYGKKDNQVSLQKRKGYEQKFPDYTCVFLNEASHLYLEVYPSDDNRSPIFMPKGIPVCRTFSATSNWAEFKSVTILKPHVVEIMSLSHPGSTELELRPNIKKVKHPRKMLDRILKERKESALRSFGLNK